MNIKINRLPKSLFLTIFILVVFEIISTGLLPILGLNNFRLPIHILLVIFLSLRIDTPFISIIIIIVQYFHSLFSIEGWALGTLAGITTSLVVMYFKDLLELSSSVITMIVTWFFQLLWFSIVAFFLYLKVDDVNFVINKFWRFIPESLVIALLSPLFYVILSKVWEVDENSESSRSSSSLQI